MAAPHNVEFEAAKFLQKLIHESTDEPAKLATKLYVILQHMKASGKENSMPYQVISRAMETVINQHGLDIEALMSSRVPLSTGSHSAEGARAQAAGCSQPVGAFVDSKSGMTENDTSRTDGFTSGRPPAAPSSTGHEPFQGCTSQRSTRSFDQESPSSMDTRSANSHSQDRRETAGWEQQGSERDPKRASIKRKRPETSGVEPQVDSSQQPDAHTGVPDMRKERFIDRGEMPGTFPGPSIDPKAGKGPVDSEYWKQGFIKGAAPNFRERVVPGHMVSPNQGDLATTNTNSASRLDAAGISHMPMNVDRLLQGGIPSNVGEMGMLRSAASRDMGKSPVTQASVTSMPFKEHHLKQLRAQCLVFLAFRNGLPPKRLHLEIALGHILPKEGSSGCVDGAQSEPMADKGKQQTTPEASSATEVTSLQGNLATLTKNERGPGSSVPTRSVTEADTISKETENSKVMDMKPGPSTDASLIDEEKKHLNGRGILDAELPSQAGGATGVNMQLKPETIRWTGVAHNDPSWSVLPASMQHDLGNRNESSLLLSQHDSSTQIQQHADNRLSTSWKAVNGMDSENHRQVASNGANLLPRTTSHEVEEEDTGFAPSPKYTLSEQWIMAHHKRKLATEQKWMQKVQKADERIVARFNELKETVSTSEDISAKTRSVIELKKLQLLELQRRLRSNILSDFFKPVQREMDQLKSIKKHRIGRRLKHVEKYEQKMKEERQKRIRERQKEFFSEVEVHRERLEEVFKFKRERCKGFNRYVKEYHKKRERIHREKIDRIQREKINLLKINDVEGYLRMVQDAKSDRVKQLLKETEKYLLKLGSKLKEAKSVARQVEMDESGIAVVDDSTDIAVETEDESDQAKHYLESNEKYYMIAHSVKENIAEQPSGLVGGKLREYQMNGLRWLVSLYNNHLNGILADEMGLGKTVQVISLLCYLMEAKNDRGPFLVVVPSSVLPGWEQEMSFWAPGINKIVYAGPPEDRRRLFKECIIHQKFNVLLTTYEYLMNKHDRPKLSKINWHYVIIDEGHRIKNASCKLNADLKHYHSAHRLLLTGTPLQNNLEELWALLNFLLPNIFNSSEDFSQWFNKPFESSVDNAADEALLSEEENLLIINRLHQVLRPFVLRRLKHKVENELPEKIERLVRCEASAYQRLLMKRVEDNLGALGVHKARSVHNSVMELRNICNHPYLSHLHSEQVDSLIPKHYLPPVVRLCGKLEMLDRLLPKLKATNHRVLLFSTMTRLLDVMEEYLVWKQYRYLRLDGHTSGQDRGALIDAFNRPDSPFFIFLLSIRAGGVGVNLQAADTVIIFDTDWNPQVDLQAQARAHRIGQKKDVLVLRLETVHTVEEQVRAAAEHKLGVANQSITAGFFDNNTSAEDRREYLESLLRESKKEEAAPVLDDDGLNDILARSESEIDVFEEIDQKRREEEMATWKRVVSEQGSGSSEDIPPLPLRLITDDDLKAFCEAMKIYEVSATEGSSAGMKRKGGYLGGLDTQVYGRGKRAREVRSYEEQWTEDEFEKMCKADSPETAAKAKEEQMDVLQPPNSSQTASEIELPSQTPTTQVLPPALVSSPLVKTDVTPSPPVKRGRGRPRRTPLVDASSSAGVHSPTIAVTTPEVQKVTTTSIVENPTGPDSQGAPAVPNDVSGVSHHGDVVVTTPSSQAVSPLPSSLDPGAQSTPSSTSVTQPKRQGRKGQSIEKNIQGQSGSEPVRRRGRKPSRILSSIPSGPVVQDPKPNDQPAKQPSSETCAPVATAPSTQSNSSLAESPGALLPKSSDGSTGLVVEDSRSSELVAPPAGTEPCKSNALPQGQIASIEEIGGDIGVQDPNANGKSDKQTPSDTSAVVSKDLLSQGQGASVPESSASLVVGTIPAVVTESPMPGSLRRGRKPSEKPQSETEPPRRRGRKRRQTVSTAPETPVVQDPNSNEQLKRTPPTVTPTVSYVAGPPSGAVNVGMDSQVVAVPVAPVSGFLPGSTALAGVSGSMHHASVGSFPNVPATSKSSPLPSGTPGIPSDIPQIPVASPQAQGQSQKGQVGETMPRRRGRRKSTVSAAGPDNLGVQNTISRQSDGKGVEIVERKVIATRSRQMSIAQSKNAQEEAHKGGTSGALVSKDSKTPVPCNLSSTVGQSGDLHLVPSQSIFGSPTASTNELGKFSELRQVTPANLPPITSSGVTNVIVLALESTAPALHSTGISLRTPSVLASKPDNVTPQLSCAPGTAILEEEMSAPPGFDTPRPSSLGASVKKSLASVDTKISKAPDAKTGSVVLGLESVMANVGPSSVTSQNKNEREESHELLTSKKTVQGSEHQSKPQGSQQEFESAPGMMAAVQPEEEMLAPPGFDIPQPETAVGIPIQCDDSQEKKDISVSSEVNHGSMGGIIFEKTQEDVNKDSSESSEPSRFSTLASQNECMDSHDDHLSAVASDSGEKIKESSDHVEEDSVPPGFVTSQAPLVLDKNNKPCESRESPIPAESVPSEGPTDSEYEHMKRETHDDVQTVKATSVVADIPMVESEEKMALVDNLNTQKDESCVVGIGEDQQCLVVSVSKLDHERGSVNVAPVSEDVGEPRQVNIETTVVIDCGQKDCTSSEVQLGDDNKSVSTSEMVEKPPEGVINMIEPNIESPISPACLDDKLSEEAGNAKQEDACQEDDGERQKRADPPMKETDAGASIEETNTMPASIINETIQKPQPEKPPTLGSISESLDDANTTLSDETQADGAHEAETNPVTLVANLIKETDYATSIEESITIPAPINDETVEKTQPEKPRASGSVSKPVGDVNTKLQDETQAVGAHETKDNTVSVVTHLIQETDIATSIEKSITVPTSVNSEATEETRPEEPAALGSVSAPRDDLDAKLSDVSVMSTDCLKCPEENVKIGDACEKDDTACDMDTDSCNSMADSTRTMDNCPKGNVIVGDPCQKGDVGREMDVDSDNVVPDVTAPINDTALSTPDTCDEESAQNLLSAGNNETMAVVSIESHIAFREEGKDGPSQGEEDYCAGSASLIESSDVQAVSVIKSTPEEKAKGVVDGSLAESKEPVKQNVGVAADDQKCSVSCDRQRDMGDVMDATLSFRNTSPAEVNADAVTLANMGESGKQVDESKRVADIDHEDGNSCDVRQAVEGEEGKRAPDVDQKDCNPCDVLQAVEGEEAERAADVDQRDCNSCDVLQAVEGEEAKRAADVDQIDGRSCDVQHAVEGGGEIPIISQHHSTEEVAPCEASLADLENTQENAGTLDDHLSAVGLDCGDNIKESEDLVEEDSVIPEFANTSLVQDKNDKPSESRVSRIPVDSGPSKDPTETCDNMQTVETTVVADVPMVESGDKLAEGDNLIIQKDESSVIDTGEKGELCRGRSISKHDDEKDSKIVAVVSGDVPEPREVINETTDIIDCGQEDCTPSELQLGGDSTSVNTLELAEKPSEDVSNLMEPAIEGPSSPCVHGKTLDEVEPEKVSSGTFTLVAEDDVKIKPSDVSDTSTEEFKCPKENAKDRDAFQEDEGACETVQKSIDDAGSIEKSITLPASISNETIEGNQPENSPVLGSVLEPGENTGLAAEENIKIGDACREDDAPREMDIDSHNLTADPIKSVDNCPEEIVEVGDACQKDDVGCEMDIDSHDVTTDATAATNSTALSIPDSCNDGSAQDCLSAGNNENVTKGSTESHVDLGDDGKDGASHGTQNDFSGTQSASSFEASVVQAVSVVKCTLEENDKEAGQKDDSCSDMPERVHAGDSVPCTSKPENSDEGKTRDPSCNVAEASEQVEGNGNDSSDIPDAVQAGDSLPSTSKPDNSDDEAGQKDVSCSDMPEAIHAGDGVPCTSRVEFSDDGNSGSNVAQAMEEDEGNVGDGSSDTPDALLGGDSVPSTSKLDNSNDGQKDDSCSDIPEAVQAGHSVPCTSREEISDDGNSGSNVTHAMEEDEGNVDDGSSDIPDAVHGGDDVPSKSKPDNSNDECGKKDDSSSDIPDAVHAGDSIPSTSKPDNSDDVESRDAGSNVAQTMEWVEGDGDDRSSDTPDGVHGSDIVPSTSKLNNSDDEAGQKDDSHSDIPEAVHAGDSASISKLENFDDAKTRDSGCSVTQAMEQVDGNGDDGSSDIPDGVHAGDSLPLTGKADNFDDETAEKGDRCSEIPDAIHDGETVPSTSKLDNSDDGETRVSGGNVDQTKADDVVSGGNVDQAKEPVEGNGGEGVPSLSKPDSTDDIITNDSSTCVTEVRDEVEGNVGVTDVSDVVHPGDSALPTTELESSDDAKTNDSSIGGTGVIDQAD